MAGALFLAAAAALLVVALAVGFGGDDGPALNAEKLTLPDDSAPLTTGTNYDGTTVSLPAKGRPAIVTFLFTHCPDICPFSANEIAKALDEVGDRADDIDVVAVSVDPSGDTPRAVRAFLRDHGLLGRMKYIVGTAAQLRPLWKDWLIAAQPGGDTTSSVHTARIVLVDRNGKQVGDYSGGLPIPDGDLAADIRTLTD